MCWIYEGQSNPKPHCMHNTHSNWLNKLYFIIIMIVWFWKICEFFFPSLSCFFTLHISSDQQQFDIGTIATRSGLDNIDRPPTDPLFNISTIPHFLFYFFIFFLAYVINHVIEYSRLAHVIQLHFHIETEFCVFHFSQMKNINELYILLFHSNSTA